MYQPHWIPQIIIERFKRKANSDNIFHKYKKYWPRLSRLLFWCHSIITIVSKYNNYHNTKIFLNNNLWQIYRYHYIQRIRRRLCDVILSYYYCIESWIECRMIVINSSKVSDISCYLCQYQTISYFISWWNDDFASD